jgi:glycosyltransferase involved in cell wall biosynthesis
MDSTETGLVTVGVCVRNGQELLPNALNSILNQTYPKNQIQIIIVDDGSQDNTPQIIREYSIMLAERAKTFKSTWQGLGHARNLIVNNADGEFILFVDSDQTISPNYVKTQVETMRRNPKVALTAGTFAATPKNPILNLEIVPHIVNQKNFGKPKSFIWKTEKLIGTGGTTFRTLAIRQVGGFDEKIKGAFEDTDLVLRIKKAGWQIEANSAELCEFHGGLSKPTQLWKKYFWYGFSSQRSLSQTRDAYSFPRMSPLSGLAAGLFYSFPAYKFLRQKQVFLLPLHYGFKHAAWTLGFMKGQLKTEKSSG